MYTLTAHFTDFSAACQYYSVYNLEMKRAELTRLVQEKLDSGAIYLGKPPVKDGEKLYINKQENRYVIESV